MVIESDKAVNNDFNISSSHPYSVKEVASRIWSKIHGDAELHFAYYPAYIYDVQIRSPDVSKAKELLGFECKKTFDDVLDEIIEWVRMQYGF